MKRILFVLIIVIQCAVQVSAQDYFLKDDSLTYDSASHVLLSLMGLRLDDSNAINREFIQKIYFGGEINDDMKSRINNATDRENLYGSETIAQFDLTVLPSSGKWGIGAFYGVANFISLDFTDDLFDLVFRGNAYFNEDAANLSNTGLTSISYQKLSLGLIHKKAAPASVWAFMTE